MSRSPLGCQVEGCERVALMRVAGARVCLTHEEPVSRTAALDQYPGMEHTQFRCFRFRRRRGGFETWLIEGSHHANLSSINRLGPDPVPLMPLREAEANALMLAMQHRFPYVDIDRCITRELMRELFRPLTAQEKAYHALHRHLQDGTLELKGEWP